METKTLPIEVCELKFDDDEWKVEGYASVFNSVDKVGDTVLPGAFSKSLQGGREIRMHMEHMRWTHPGKWVDFREDQHGLKATGYLTRDHSQAKDLRASMRHGTVRGLSIGFVIPEGGAEKKGDIRLLKEIELHEVSFTGTPAEPQAMLTAWKSELSTIESLSDFESFLRDSGANISKSMATALTSHLKRLILSESEQAEEEIKRERQRQAEEFKAALNRYQLKILNLTNKELVK